MNKNCLDCRFCEPRNLNYKRWDEIWYCSCTGEPLGSVDRMETREDCFFFEKINGEKE